MTGNCYMCEQEAELSNYYGHGAMMCKPCIDYADKIQSYSPEEENEPKKKVH